MKYIIPSLALLICIWWGIHEFLINNKKEVILNKSEFFFLWLLMLITIISWFKD